MTNICKLCQKEIGWIRIDENGKKRCIGKRSHCLDCVPFGSRFKVNPIGRKKKHAGLRSCSSCQRLFNQSGRNLECSGCRAIDRRYQNKLKAIEYKGGKCVNCGYKKCFDSLDFHHLDPRLKFFNISKQLNNSWRILQPELDKCILVCKNCHGEIHAGISIVVQVSQPQRD